MKNPKRALRLLLLLLVALGLSGCWDRKELEDTGFVVSMGLDKAEEGKVALTVQIAVPRALGGSTGGGGGGGGDPSAPPVLVERVVEPTVSEALRTLETFTSRRISFAQIREVIIGRALAEESITPFIGILTRNREMRRTMQLIVADGKAADMLTMGPVLEREPAGFIEDLTRRAREVTGQAPRRDLHDFLKAYEGFGRVPALPLIRRIEAGPGWQSKPADKLQLRGTAIMKNGRMVGELDPEETEAFLLLSAYPSTFFETFPAPGHPECIFVVSLQGTSERVQVNLSGKQPRIDVQIITEGEIREAENAPAELFTTEGLARLEAALATQLSRESNQLVHKLQQKYGADIVGFGEHVKRRFWDWPSWTAYNWPERFPQAEIHVTIRTHLRRLGMTFQPTVPAEEAGSGVKE